MIVHIRPSRLEDGDRVVSVWRASVDATHHFLSQGDRQAIDLEVQAFLPSSPLWLAVDDRDHVLGLMGLSRSHMEALFIDPTFRGAGVGEPWLNAPWPCTPASRPMPTSKMIRLSASTAISASSPPGDRTVTATAGLILCST